MPSPDRPLAGIDGQGLYAGRDRCGLLRRGAQERLCELHDARLAHDALRRLDRPCRAPKPLPGNAPQHRVYEEHLFRLQGVQPSQHEYRRGRPLHAEGHDARQCERDPLAACDVARENVGRYALVDGAVALLRFGIRVLSAAGEELHPVGTGVAGAFSSRPPVRWR